ncbi:hypothetical protein [Candidatus Amarobacter glycogenicus]|uniref:hypothetical protein n=1 Tax=Candidatus Amarobacter glycogenicus TaxID=3140699 RepID=UPI002A141E46|nr:hypothetical protein [Dehalococcoidia bacterium]MCC6267898.1 hypothetical protein [Dehalococcoidia bacterium]
MRKIHTFGLALLGLILAAGSFGFAAAADSPAPTLVRRAFMPAIAGDSGASTPGQATSTPQPPTGCAGLRTEVRVLADALAGFDRTPEASSVNQLLLASRPAGVTDATARLSPFEDRVVEMTVYLLGFQRTASGGIELAISQAPNGEAMLAYFPSSSCLSKTPVESLAAAGSARTALQLACGNPPDSGLFKPLGGSATITGVPFWGRQHTNTTGAASGVELGPALSFAFNPATSCDADASKTPYPTSTPTPVVQEILTGVLPQTTQPGTTVTVTIYTVPAVAGKLCGFSITDAAYVTVASAPLKATGADGQVSWQVALPPTTAIGKARVQPNCPGLPTDGSASLYIVS